MNLNDYNFSMQTQLLLLVLASARALDQSMAPTLSAMERRIVSLTVPTQWILLLVPMPGMLESTAMKHVSTSVITAHAGNRLQSFILYDINLLI